MLLVSSSSRSAPARGGGIADRSACPDVRRGAALDLKINSSTSSSSPSPSASPWTTGRRSGPGARTRRRRDPVAGRGGTLGRSRLVDHHRWAGTWIRSHTVISSPQYRCGGLRPGTAIESDQSRRTKSADRSRHCWIQLAGSSQTTRLASVDMRRQVSRESERSVSRPHVLGVVHEQEDRGPTSPATGSRLLRVRDPGHYVAP